jgi:hypothetical protein
VDPRGSGRRRSAVPLASGRGSGMAPLQPSLDLDRVVARVEDEQGDDPFFKPAQQSLDLFGGDHVGVLGGPDTLYVYGGGPALAGEAELCGPLVGPAGDDATPGGSGGREKGRRRPRRGWRRRARRERLPCGGSIRRTSDGKREEHREVPWCAHHAPIESFPHHLPPAQLKRKLRVRIRAGLSYPGPLYSKGSMSLRP